MTAQTIVLLLFLVLIRDLSCSRRPNPFQLEADSLSAVEGSCTELRCSVTIPSKAQTDNAHWFWIKDPEYTTGDFEGTIIYSSNTTARPVSPYYKDRVNYTGSYSASWRNDPEKPTCSVLICDLKKSDWGVYAFRYIRGDTKWMAQPKITLTVKVNPCPITLEKPPVVKDSSNISLKCSTLKWCSSDLQIQVPTQQFLEKSVQNEEKMKSISRSFQVNWQDDGKEVSCQTRGNNDPHLIRKTSLTVQYAPRDVSALMSPQGMIKEKQSVTLRCSFKGNPTPSVTWFVNNTKTSEGAELKFSSITASQSGQYACEAGNKFDSLKSSPISIDVNYQPEVKVMTSSTGEFTEGERINLTCAVTRSKPEPTTYSWFKDGNQIIESQMFVVTSVTPEDSGSYSCGATNSVGTGTSAEHQIKVRYAPRKTKIFIPENKITVKAGDSLTFICLADAYPLPSRVSWHRTNTDRNRRTDHSQWESGSRSLNSLLLERVERTDDACYVCNATNDIGTGEDSEPVCIQVLYPPTIPRLSMDNLVNEGQPTTIHCTVESFPQSRLTLTRKSGSKYPKEVFTHPEAHTDPNKLSHTFNATPADYGSYTCKAENGIGSKQSVPEELVVKYPPKDVTVKYKSLVVNENTPLKLDCSALAYPPVKSFTWTKTKDGKTESMWSTQRMTVESVSPSDSGLYSCTAWNEVGSGTSQRVEIKVRYAPTLTKITRGAEKQLHNGRSSVTLSCISDGYPEATKFSWYKKTQEKDVEVSYSKTYTVYSDEPGDYYCTAKNEINGKSSELIQMFADRSFVKILIIFFLLVMLVVLLFIIIYRHRRSKSVQRRNSNTPSSFGSWGWWDSISRRNEPTLAEPFRSRDDLLTDQPPHPDGRRRQQPRPDNTPASTAVYYTVNLPASQQGPSGEAPVKQKARHTQDESLNYASINIMNKEKQKKKRAEVDTVYAIVSKNKTPKKTEQENLDYENLKTAHVAKSLNAPSYDSDTSEDEVELNYSQVNFKPKPGHQRTNRDSSSTSSEEETQYSQVKI